MFGLVRLTEEEKGVLLQLYAQKEKHYELINNAASEALGCQFTRLPYERGLHRLHELGIPFKYTKQNGIEPVDKI